MTWPELMDLGLNKLDMVPADPDSYTVSSGPKLRKERLRRVLSSNQCGVKDVEGAIDALSWLGLLGSEGTGLLGVDGGPAVEPVTEPPIQGDCPIEALSALLTAHRGLSYQQGERDMVAMYHTVVGVMPDGTEERHTSRLMAFGAPVGEKERGALGRKEEVDKDKGGGVEGGGDGEQEGDTAMSATVGYTTGAAVELLLQLNPNAIKANPSHTKGGIDDPRSQAVGPLEGRAGVMIPITADIYDPILHRLNDLGITWTESVTVTDTRS
jgi:Saccharopine dehydrogenase C-terminal domain